VIDDQADDADEGTATTAPQAAMPNVGPALDEAAATFLDDLGEPDNAEACEASMSGR